VGEIHREDGQDGGGGIQIERKMVSSGTVPSHQWYDFPYHGLLHDLQCPAIMVYQSIGPSAQ